MDFAALCDICKLKWHQWTPLDVFSVNIAFAHHFVATQPPHPPTYSSISGTGYASKMLSKIPGNSPSYPLNN